KLNRLRAIYESNKERGGPALVPYPGKDRPVVSRTPDGSLTATAVVKDPEGMHCRAWAVIREFLQERDATITIRWRGRTATLTGRTVYPGFSIVRRLLDPVKCGDEMSVTVEGPDAAEVMEAMLLITQRGGYRKVLRSEYVRKRRAGATG
ncbi:MAG: HPr family phosphocarrier protein, partial [Rubrobacter sp.]|nr:HPr family phosphocarrier protein [Rubrobacter sp.]